MNKLILAGAAALAFATAAPAIAQDAVAVDAMGNVYVLTDAQKVMYDGWPAERRTMYDTWPNTLQEYYWSLDTARQTGWWVLNDGQRAQVYAMTPEQREAAWAQIAAQMGSTSAVATAAAHSDHQGMPTFVSSAVVQSTPASDNANVANGADLPVCKPNQQDGCINGWEKNKTGNRPLNYWPGKPASEIPGKKPMAK